MKNSTCIITEANGYGGTEAHTLSVVKVLQERDSRIRLVQCRHSVFDALIEQVSGDNVSMVKTDLSTLDRDPEPIKRWRNLLQSMDSEILLLQKGWNDMGSIPFLRECRAAFRKVYFVEHTLPNPMPPKTSGSYLGGLIRGPGLWWYRRKYERMKPSVYSDGIIAVSRSVAESLSKECGYPRKKITTIPNGVYPDKFRRNEKLGARFREKYNISSHAFLFGMITRMDKIKGIDTAIRSFESVCRQRPDGDPFLVICGCGEEEETLRVLVKTLDIKTRVIFTGFIDQPLEALSAIDCILFPSKREGLPLALLEGMAAGCIPVVTNVGGMPEIIDKPSLGWVVRPDSIHDFSLAMNEVRGMDNAGLYAMRKSVAGRVERHFNAEKSYERIANTLGII